MSQKHLQVRVKEGQTAKKLLKTAAVPKKMKGSKDSPKSPRGRRRSQAQSTTTDDDISPAKVSRRSRSAATNQTKGNQNVKESDSDHVSEDEVSEAEYTPSPRSKGKRNATPSSQQISPSKSSGRRKIATTPDSSSQESTTSKTSKSTRNSRNTVSDNLDEDNEVTEEETTPVPKPRATKGKRGGRKANDVNEEDENSEEEVTPEPKTRGRRSTESNETKSTRNKRKSKVDMKAVVNLEVIKVKQSSDEEESKEVKKGGRGRPKKKDDDSDSYPSTLSVCDADVSEDSTIPSSQEKPKRGRQAKKTIPEPEVETLQVGR